MDNKLYGGIETGGTKFVCCVGNLKGNILARTEIATTTVDHTLQNVYDFFKRSPRIISLGVGSFGRLELNRASPKFGYVTNTPKLGWGDTNIKGLLEEALGVPVAIDTDVNCAALGEKHFGLAQQSDN